MAWVRDNAQPLVDVQNVLDSFVEDFDISTATGKQLDILGEILALPRTVNFDPGGGQSAVLTDDVYRIALKAQILKTTWKGTKKAIYDFWQAFLPEYPVLILDNQDMSMDVLVVGMPDTPVGAITFGYDSDTIDVQGYDLGYWEGFTSVLRGLVLNGYFTPKPAAVEVNYSFLEDAGFSYDENTDLLKGYDESYWVSLT
jgi:hypothetical protein